MPFVLRWMCLLFSFVGAGFIISSFIPFGTYTINGRNVMFSELWSSGAAVLFIIIGAALLSSAIGMYRARNWGRIVFMALILSPWLLVAVLDRNLNALIPAMFPLMILGWYLFLKPTVKQYFYKPKLESEN